MDSNQEYQQEYEYDQDGQQYEGVYQEDEQKGDGVNALVSDSNSNDSTEPSMGRRLQ